MRLQSSIFIILAGLLGVGCGEGNHEIMTTRKTLSLGDGQVTVVVHEAAAPGPTYINLHEDESTSVEAALDVIRRTGGRVLSLAHGGTRNVTFALGDSTFVFDPNRMFTDAGAARSLDTLSTAASPSALAAVRGFADSLLTLIDLESLDVIVTLHNNSDTRYSALSYTPGEVYAIDAQFVHLADDADPDDFFFVTDLDLYDALRAGGFNVVLQDNARATDDGSLSVYAGQRVLPYVNVEAQHGHFEAQVRMLEFLNRLLRAPAEAA